MIRQSARGESEKLGHGDISDEKDKRQHTTQQARFAYTYVYIYNYIETRDKYQTHIIIYIYQ